MTELLDGPLLSVVIPCYNVEAWLGECLDSVTSQSLTDLEVVVVIDGSPDDSAAVAHGRASLDPRIRVIDRAHNIGLGASRNEGLREARGTYVTFADSDDLVAPGAYEALVESLGRTGSDLAIGWASEFGGPRGRRRYWTTATRLHDTGAEGASLDTHPELITDHVAWNKVFRREFLVEHGITWPEGVKCEDVLQTTDSLIAARAVDVVPVEVIRYRRREGQITGSLDSGATLLDWATQTQLTLGRLSAPRWERSRALYAERVLHGEMRSRLVSIVRSTDPAVLTAVGSVLSVATAACPAERLTKVDQEARHAYVLLAAGRADLVTAVAPTLGEPGLTSWPKSSRSTLRRLCSSLDLTESRWVAELLGATLVARANHDIDRLEADGSGLVAARALSKGALKTLPAPLRAALDQLEAGGDASSARTVSWLARYTNVMATGAHVRDGALVVQITVRCTMIDSSAIELRDAEVRTAGGSVAATLEGVGVDGVRRIVADVVVPLGELPDEDGLRIFLTVGVGEVGTQLRLKIAADVPEVQGAGWKVSRAGAFVRLDPVHGGMRRAKDSARSLGRKVAGRLARARASLGRRGSGRSASTRKATS